MTRLEVRHAWLQKHPSPSVRSGEFHWYAPGDPGDGAAPAAASQAGAPSAGRSEGREATRDAQLRGLVVEQVQGLTPPTVWWELSPGRLLWASVWAATSPSDARRYRGVALSVVEGEAEAAELLAQLRPATPAPHGPTAIAASSEPLAGAPLDASRALDARTWGDPTALARALLEGGTAMVADPHDPRLPAWLAGLEALVPPALTLPRRRGLWRALGSGPGATTGAAGASSGPGERAGEEVAACLAAAWCADDQASGRRDRQAWRVSCELAQWRGCGLRELLERSALVSELAAQHRELELLGPAQRATWAQREGRAAPSWRRLLHGWGRGWLDGAADSAELAGRLAEGLALRALAALRAGADAGPVLAEARWHALLPAVRRRALWAELQRCAPTLLAEPPSPPSPHREHRERPRAGTKERAHVA